MNAYQEKCYRVVHYAEIGLTNTIGSMQWDQTLESIPFPSRKWAINLRERWLKDGKMIVSEYGNIKPKFEYGLFRIRRVEELIVEDKSDVAQNAEALATYAESGYLEWDQGAETLRRLAAEIAALRRELSLTRESVVKEAISASKEPIAKIVYDVWYKKDFPVTSHGYQKVQEAVESELLKMLDSNDKLV